MRQRIALFHLIAFSIIVIFTSWIYLILHKPIAGILTASSTPTFFLKSLMYLLLPLLTGIAMFAVWGMIAFIRKSDKATLKRNVIVSLIVVLFVLFPSIT